MEVSKIHKDHFREMSPNMGCFFFSTRYYITYFYVDWAYILDMMDSYGLGFCFRL